MKRKKSSEVEGMWTRSPLVFSPPLEFQLKRHANLMPPPPAFADFPIRSSSASSFYLAPPRLFCDQYGVLGRGDAS